MAGLYIHIPFCLSKCRYCDFPSFAGEEAWISRYLDALVREMDVRQSELSPPPFATVFFGGGTPSLLCAQSISRLLDALRARFSIAPGAEITMECNPGTVEKPKLIAYRQAGINRLSIGLQSADDRLLSRIGRIHTRAQFEAAFAQARRAGFANINVDAMHGLPGQTQADYLDTLTYLARLAPEHISAYGLILEEHTPLMEDVAAGREQLPLPDEVADMQDAGMAYLSDAGYARYEISNFAKPGYECRHNINYWENGAYLGLGLGAHSAWRRGGEWQRFENPGTLSAYIEQAGTPIRPNVISLQEERFETVMLGLRMTAGLSLRAFRARFGQEFADVYPEQTKALTADGLLVLEHGYARLSARGLDLQNTVLLSF